MSYDKTVDIAMSIMGLDPNNEEDRQIVEEDLEDEWDD